MLSLTAGHMMCIEEAVGRRRPPRLVGVWPVERPARRGSAVGRSTGRGERTWRCCQSVGRTIFAICNANVVRFRCHTCPTARNGDPIPSHLRKGAGPHLTFDGHSKLSHHHRAFLHQAQPVQRSTVEIALVQTFTDIYMFRPFSFTFYSGQGWQFCPDPFGADITRLEARIPKLPVCAASHGLPILKDSMLQLLCLSP
ncbi:hypothetical protein CRG98_034126 [Punica granatum]|uniref:Uncharacterized protein n=1 Tax=Punica granatum TaxID=22663 RepID=A0A2I0IN84_PUNGR|nr:hypothetical protein CRG98_034126 [Punica granatum]